VALAFAVAAGSERPGTCAIGMRLAAATRVDRATQVRSLFVETTTPAASAFTVTVCSATVSPPSCAGTRPRCTVPVGGTTCADVVGTVDVPAGGVVEVQVQGQGSALGSVGYAAEMVDPAP
jgi:hypothetical protein